MRINKWLAERTSLSRRKADEAISSGRVFIDGRKAAQGDLVNSVNSVTLDGSPVQTETKRITIMLNKPVGYVCSRNGQGSETIYELLPPKYQHLNPVGRLDKDSSGLLLLTNDGDLANQLTHPKFHKEKVYEVILDKPLRLTDQNQIEQGVELDDGLSRLKLTGNGKNWTVTMSEGRNRQIRRTFYTLGYEVIDLQRESMGDYRLGGLKWGEFIEIQ